MKKLFSIVLSMAMLVSAPSISATATTVDIITAFAQDFNSANDNAVSTEEYTSISAKSYLGASAYEEDVLARSICENTSMKISTARNMVSITLALSEVALEERESLSGKEIFIGEVFSLNGGGYYDNIMILGSFAPTADYSIALFKILNENSTPVLTLLVENINSGELTEYSFHISASLFDKLMSIAQSTTKSHEDSKNKDGDISPERMVAQEVIALMQPSKNYKSLENSLNMRTQSNSSFKSTTSYVATAASLNVVQTFCASINAATSSGITPSATMQSVLSQTGWKMYKTSTHFYVMHGVANTSTEQLVGITVCSVSSEKTYGQPELTALYTVVGSATLSYDKSTKVATLLQYNTGIRLEDASIAVELVGGTTNLLNATKTKNLEGGGSLKNLFVAVLNSLGVPADIWTALQTSGDSSDTVPFGSDANQAAVWGNGVEGNLVRAAANQGSSSYYLWGYGTYIGIIAHYKTDPGKTYSSYRTAWGFTAYSLL